jgi:hypothetical protein
MKDLVEWWQMPDPQLLRYVVFNHGERIRRRWVNQIDRAVRTLENSVGSTRAVIALFDPWTDGEPSGPFPSFVLIQLQLVVRSGVKELDCSGYFRKQEMAHWWPINVAELAKVQASVREGLSSSESLARPGKLRTTTAHAVIEDKLPAVALSSIDRAIDQHPEDLWSMGYCLVHGEYGDREEARARWKKYLGDLDPSDAEPSDELPTSFRGLSDVQEVLAWLGVGDGEVGEAISDLVGFYNVLHAQGRPVRSDPETVARTKELLKRLHEAVDGALGEQAES